MLNEDFYLKIIVLEVYPYILVWRGFLPGDCQTLSMPIDKKDKTFVEQFWCISLISGKGKKNSID